MKEKMSGLSRFGVSMEEDLLSEFDRLIERKGYATRSEALRDMVRQALAEESLTDDHAEAVATISLVYDHHSSNLTSKLTDAQHHWLDIIVSTTHIHLDAHSCLEVLVVRGPAGQVKKLADFLISIKGVKYGKFAATALETKPGSNRHHLHKR